jgi:hypothetical protein
MDIDSQPLSPNFFQRQFYFGISPPRQSSTDGPWNDNLLPSPIIQRKFELSNTPGTYKVQVVTIGRPDDKHERRIKIYEHDIIQNDFDLPLICEQIVESPGMVLKNVNGILQNPKTARKMVDKVLNKASALKAIVGAQQSLLHFFGTWLNPMLVPNHGILAATEGIYLLDFCPVHGTVARPLNTLPKESSRNQVKEAIAASLPAALDSAWDHHPDMGFSVALAVPIGKFESSYYC